MSTENPVSRQLAAHFREAHFGNNWSWVSLKQHLEQVSLEAAQRRIGNFNTIAQLAYHVYYYIDAQLRVLEGGELDSRDSLSWQTPEFVDEASWKAFLRTSWEHVEKLAALIEALPDEQLREPFAGGKYGNYYHNLSGVIEHCYYHLGQIVLIRKAMGTEVN